MDPSTWLEAKDIFAAALAAAPGDRDRLIDERCAGRDALRVEVQTLLAAHLDAGEFMDAPAVAAAPWLFEAPSLTLAGRRIGPFRLAEPLGSGGSSVVYRAERVEGGFEQQVAIKILDAPLRQPAALSRFYVERQILARLTHPHIVSFIDSGIAGDGRAFLVMELVKGVRLTDYCRERALPLDERLELVEAVCHAVQHAHQHGVIHRDLKPGNILVSDEGVPKILDFGVSKLVGGDPGGGDATLTGMVKPLTPDYASPEQIRGQHVTTASDVYALGVVLYEVVTGRRPYDTSGHTLERVAEIVTTQDPPRPSHLLTEQHVPRGGSPLAPHDLDAIVRKAMHKDPGERYASAQELAADLARCRAGHPVVAREPSLGYVLRKAARRHRAAAAALAVSLVAVLAALGVSLWQMRRVAAERDRAQARFDDARRIANALIFKVHDTIAPIAGTTPARKLIVEEALTYLERLAGDPLVDDALRLELAEAYRRIGDVQGGPEGANLGDRDGARKSLERAIALLEPLAARPGAAPATISLLAKVEQDLASLIQGLGDRPAALVILKRSADRAERLYRDHPADTDIRSLVAAGHFWLALSVPRAEALPHWQQAAAVYDSLLQEAPDNSKWQRNVALVSKYMGAYFERDADYDRARAHYVRALEIDRPRAAASPGSRDAIFDLAIDLGNIANVDWRAGRTKEAEDGFKESLALREKLVALDPAEVQARGRVAFMHGRLAEFYSALERPREALPHARTSAAILDELTRLSADERQPFAWALVTLGQIERRAAGQAAGCATFRRAARVVADLVTATPTRTEALQKLEASVAGELGKCGG